MVEYIKIWHNRKRHLSQRRWLTPIQFEPNGIIDNGPENQSLPHRS
jgi:hypothetical protein